MLIRLGIPLHLFAKPMPHPQNMIRDDTLKNKMETKLQKSDIKC